MIITSEKFSKLLSSFLKIQNRSFSAKTIKKGTFPSEETIEKLRQILEEKSVEIDRKIQTDPSRYIHDPFPDVLPEEISFKIKKEERLHGLVTHPRFSSKIKATSKND